MKPLVKSKSFEQCEQAFDFSNAATSALLPNTAKAKLLGGGLAYQFRTEVEGLLMSLQHDVLHAVELLGAGSARLEDLLKSNQEQILQCVVNFLQQLSATSKKSKIKRRKETTMQQVTEGTRGPASSDGCPKTIRQITVRKAVGRQPSVDMSHGTLRCDVACQTDPVPRDLLPQDLHKLPSVASTAAKTSLRPSTAYKCASSKQRRPRRMSDAILDATRKAIVEEQSLIARFVSHSVFEAASCTLIFLNYAFLIYSLQLRAAEARQAVMDGTEPRTLSEGGEFAAQCVFVFAFFAEVLVRWYAAGFVGFFFSSARVWNIVDIVVVLLECVCLMLEALSYTDVNGLGTVRIMRALRVARLAKVIRIMRFFRELRLMITSILRSIKSLVWVIITMVLIVGSFSIAFTQIVLGEVVTLADWRNSHNADVIKHFGDISTSFLSLFMAMTGGDDWGVFYSSFPHEWINMKIVFIAYIVFAIFALMNIVTAVFIESSMNSSMKDREQVIHEEERAREHYYTSMYELFQEIDVSGTGMIDEDEFMDKMGDERVRTYFRALKLDISSAQYLFTLLDHDNSGMVSIEEFVEGCFRLQGEARALDMKVMSVELTTVREYMKVLARDMQSIQQALHHNARSHRMATNGCTR